MITEVKQFQDQRLSKDTKEKTVYPFFERPVTNKFVINI